MSQKNENMRPHLASVWKKFVTQKNMCLGKRFL